MSSSEPRSVCGREGVPFASCSSIRPSRTSIAEATRSRSKSQMASEPHAPRLYRHSGDEPILRLAQAWIALLISRPSRRPFHSSAVDASWGRLISPSPKPCLARYRSIVLIGLAIPGSPGSDTGRSTFAFSRPSPRHTLGSCCPIPRCSPISRWISRSSSRSDDIGTSRLSLMSD
jgi:hypothetical protein